MALTDTFVRNAKSDKPAGQKHADGNGMYLLVTPSGKYWRLDYRHLGKPIIILPRSWRSSRFAGAALPLACHLHDLCFQSCASDKGHGVNFGGGSRGRGRSGSPAKAAHLVQVMSKRQQPDAG
jgi:hypothetical protein